MYKIIGADQKEYGPVTAYQINQWIVQGRVNALTKAKPDGGEWKSLSQFPEFAEALANRAASPPPLLHNLPAPSQSGGGNGLAVASLVLGVLGLPTCGITAIVGLILGIIALIQTGKGNGTGRGTALAGTIVSGVFLLMLPVSAALFIPALAKAKSRSLSVACISNAHQLDIATLVYLGSHTNQLPQAATWCDDLLPFAGTTNVFQCPANTNGQCGYAFNTNLSGMNMSNINPGAVLLFESDGGWNASGGRDSAIRQSRHGRTVVVAFADGHVEAVAPERIDQLRWKP